MEIIGKTTFVRMSPRKIRLVAETIKGLSPQVALEKLKFINKRATIPLINVLRQAVGNAKNNFNLNVDSLVIKEIQVLEGPRLKRLDKSHGARFDRGLKQKRMSHIKITLIETTPLKRNQETQSDGDLMTKEKSKKKIVKRRNTKKT